MQQLVSKAKVGPVLMMRLDLKFIMAMEVKPDKLWIVGDSGTILVCREKQAGYIKEYFRNCLCNI